MLIIVGYLIIIASVAGGFVAAGGQLGVLWQPVEVVIICGAAFAAFMMSSGTRLMKEVGKGVASLFKASPYKKALYLQTLTLISEICNKARREGLLGIEADIEDPEKSPTFQKAPLVLKDHHAMEFICDYLRMIVSGQLDPHEMENLMDLEIETHHHEAMQPVEALRKLADGLPAFGIVAAVLGVVVTMGSVDKPPAILGGLIGAALVGTFLGILLAYGFVSPLVNALETRVNEAGKYLQVWKAGLLALVTGAAPATAVEYSRKVINSGDRPGFLELEEHLKKAKTGAA